MYDRVEMFTWIIESGRLKRPIIIQSISMYVYQKNSGIMKSISQYTECKCEY